MWTIPSIIDHIKRGQVRVPAFQRGFVWTPEKAALLMDSIYRGYPVGSVLVWETKEVLESERALGGIDLPSPEDNYPIFYILDGQQRITSLFASFQDDLAPSPSTDWVPIYFDASTDLGEEANRFAALLEQEVDPRRHIRLTSLLKSSRLVKDIIPIAEEYRDQVNTAADRFNAFSLPLIKLAATTPSADVALVFERINSTGVPLDTYQLLTAWTWKRDFDLRDRFETLAEDLSAFGFGPVSDDPDLLLKCCGAVVISDARLRSIVKMGGPQLRDRFDQVEAGVKGAVEFVRNEFMVSSVACLPYLSMLVPLSSFFATAQSAGYMPDALQTKTIKQWFWRSCYARRYSHSLDTAHAADIKGMTLLKSSPGTSCWIEKPNIKSEVFVNTRWSSSTVLGKLHAIALAQLGPVSFLSGTNVKAGDVLVSGNSAQFHHIYPKNYLTSRIPHLDRTTINCLANISIINASDNRRISNKAPSVYRRELDENLYPVILMKHLLPPHTFNDDFEGFLIDRSAMLAKLAERLMD